MTQGYVRSLTMLEVWCQVSVYQYSDLHKVGARAGVWEATAREMCAALVEYGWISTKFVGHTIHAKALFDLSATVRDATKLKRAQVYAPAAKVVDSILTTLMTGSTRANLCRVCDITTHRYSTHIGVLKKAGRVHRSGWYRPPGGSSYQEVLMLGPGEDVPPPPKLTSHARTKIRAQRVASQGFSVFTQGLK